jgi:hypothetical protein
MTAQAPPKLSLFHEDHAAQVFYQRGRAGYLVITFSELTMKADGNRFWGDRTLGHLGIPALGFVHKRPRWFSDDFMNQSMAAAAPKVAEHAERISYGFSMGAYGAIRHAARLGVRTTIACSPQWSIEPAKLKGVVQPYARHFREDRHLGMELNSFPESGRLYLLYDPYDRHDAWHAGKIREHIRQTVLIGMPFMGHGSVRPFANTPMMAALLEAARSHDDELMRRVALHARRRYSRRGELLQLRRGARQLKGAASL